jgi:hypothetical protein
MNKTITVIILTGLLLLSCGNKKIETDNQKSVDYDITAEENGIKTIHVFTALCDGLRSISKMQHKGGKGIAGNRLVIKFF